MACTCDSCQLKKIVNLLNKQGEKLMGLKEDLSAVTTQLGKSKDELVAKLQELSDQVAAGQVDPQTVADLQAMAQSLDDIVPDAAPEEPPVEPPA